ncbi:MAG TPA: glycosyltransferase family 4 protein [Candidatus Binataceae bacterium]|nr:glycosyltransferase family 4 protein [Candidatus Binataceae bacterium]
MSSALARVLHVVPALFSANDGVVGGAERYAFELARHMADEVPTRLVTFGDEAREDRVGNLHYRVIGNSWYVRGERQNPFSTALIGELRAADVVHCHQQHIVASSVAALFCRMSGRRAFVTDEGGGGFDVSAFISTDRWFTAHLHLSNFARARFGHADKPWAQVILGGVDTVKFAPDDSIRRDVRALFVGRILPHKGVADLIEAVEPPLGLEIIGRAYDRSFVAALRTRAEGKEVTFRHDVSDSELVEAYRRALCVVLPSVYRAADGGETPVPELLGQTLLEGMACGAPAICTAVASMTEIVEDGVNGFVVPPNNPQALRERIIFLREHPETARAMGLAARQRVLEKFTWPRVVKRCLEIYAA